jgi:outer membrane lipoprotein-sorting protein
MKKLMLIVALMGLSMAPTLAVPQQEPEVLNAAQQTDVINKVQRYLDGLKKLKAHLVQTNTNGTVMQGELHLDRPGKMRLTYEGAVPVLMIADGEKFIYQEGNQDPTSYAIDSTPAGILLQKSLKLQKDINVLTVSRWHETIAVTLARPGDDDSMALTLMFKEQGTTLSLLGWSLRQQEKQTHVQLTNQEVPKTLDPRLFEWGAVP